MKSRRNRKDWNRRQPKRPPNWMKTSAEICECRRSETGDGNEKKLTRTHSKNAKMRLLLFVVQDRNSKSEMRASPIAKEGVPAGMRRDRLSNPHAKNPKARNDAP